MNECDLIGQFFMRTISGAIAFIVGTGVAYALFIGPYLRKIEYFKERLRVYKDVYKRSSDFLVTINRLKKNPAWTDKFGQEGMEFTKSMDADKLFMSPDVMNSYGRVVEAIEELPPDQYPKPPELLRYPEAKVSKLEHHFRKLHEAIGHEMRATQFGAPVNALRRIFERFGL